MVRRSQCSFSVPFRPAPPPGHGKKGAYPIGAKAMFGSEVFSEVLAFARTMS